MISASNVAILAGGLGTRLFARSGDLPKPMVTVCEKPLLQHQIELCRKHGFADIALLVHHRHASITEYFKDGREFGVRLNYSIEDNPRGTAGALRDALPILAERFLLLYGDTFIDVNLRKLWEAHTRSGAVGTLFLHPNDHPQDSDIVEIDAYGAVRAIAPYPRSPGRECRNLVNAALYVLERNGLECVTPAEGKADIAKHMFPQMLALGRHLHGYVSPEYIKDMGTPERLDQVERDVEMGIPELRSDRHLRRAVFLDRDGTINREVRHLRELNQLQLLPGSAAAIRRLNRAGILGVVVTNQPVIARGELSFEELNCIHARLESQLGADGAFLDGLYFCPHHPDKGFSGEISELKGPCYCRKPEVGLIDQACRDLRVDRQSSWMVGDATSDVEAGRRAGLRTVLLRSGYAGTDAKYVVRPDYVANDLEDAVEWILVGHVELTRSVVQIAVETCRSARLVLIGGLPRARKKYAAQVLKEVVSALGCRAHVISLDGWLNSKPGRNEHSDIRKYFNLTAASVDISEAACSSVRTALAEPLYSVSGPTGGGPFIEHSVGPKDILIVEGVPALLMDNLLVLRGVVKIFVDVMPDAHSCRIQRQRISADDQPAITALLKFNETSFIEQSRSRADFFID